MTDDIVERMESLRRENVRAIKKSLARGRASRKVYNEGFDVGLDVARTIDAGEYLADLLAGIEHGYEKAQWERLRIVTETYRPAPPRPPAGPTPEDRRYVENSEALSDSPLYGENTVDVRKWYAWPLWLIVGPLALVGGIRRLRRGCG